MNFSFQNPAILDTATLEACFLTPSEFRWGVAKIAAQHQPGALKPYFIEYFTLKFSGRDLDNLSKPFIDLLGGVLGKHDLATLLIDHSKTLDSAKAVEYLSSYLTKTCPLGTYLAPGSTLPSLFSSKKPEYFTSIHQELDRRDQESLALAVTETAL